MKYSRHPRGKTMKIRFCEHNKGTGKVYRALKAKYPGLNIKRKDCLKKCAQCKKSVFVLLNGKMVGADGGNGLYDKVVAVIEAKE